MEYVDIFAAAEQLFGDKEWGCLLLATAEDWKVKKEFPHGMLVRTGDGDYWLWLSKD